MGDEAISSVAAETVSSGVAVRFRFPGRRYHATPWGHHVNEGLIEWPPSPWRILRSFLATGYTKLHWDPSGPPPAARTLVEKLCTRLPRYRIPKAVGTHSRHYMPTARFDKGREQTTLVLDTWAQIDDDWLGVHWDVELSEQERTVLDQLVCHLGYLGRSESWIEGDLMSEAPLCEFDVYPGEHNQCPGPGWEQVALLALEQPGSYAAWRENSVRSDQAKLPRENAKGKAFTKAQAGKQIQELERAYPQDLIACLQVDTRFLQALGWSQPPGTRKVFYWRRADALSPSPALGRHSASHASDAEFILLALASQSRNQGDLPSCSRTLPQGELLHRAILSRCPDGSVPTVLSGRDSIGRPLRKCEGHRHAHILHLDLDGDQHLDHVLLWAPMGFDMAAQRAVRAVRHEVAKKAKRPHRVVVAALGRRGDILEVRSALTPAPIRRLHSLLGGSVGSKAWVSVTPFVPPRFLKVSGKNSLDGQIRSELLVRGLPEPIAVEVLDVHHGTDADRDLARRGRHFIRRRSNSRVPPPNDCGFMVRLQFAESVSGPIILGYGCHFGMGAFEGVLT